MDRRYVGGSKRFKGLPRADFCLARGPEIAAKLFEPFATFGKTHGTGLGLSICKKIIQDHGGDIFSRTEPGRGAIFVFSLFFHSVSFTGDVVLSTRSKQSSPNIENIEFRMFVAMSFLLLLPLALICKFQKII